jgi:hypothetical protein
MVSVRQVTQRNAGRKTPGIDGEVALTSAARADIAVRVHRSLGGVRHDDQRLITWKHPRSPQMSHQKRHSLSEGRVRDTNT